MKLFPAAVLLIVGLVFGAIHIPEMLRILLRRKQR